jgi:hypothetical protein
MTDLKFWTPPTIWAGQAAHVLASGPSATPDVIERLKGRNVIAVNSTILAAPWAPVWFFMDGTVLLDRHTRETKRSQDGRDMVDSARKFPGLVVTTSKWLKAALPDVVKLAHAPALESFPRPGSTEIRSGRSSGQTAISLAIAMGAAEIYLHGLDMRVVDGREHHHCEYEGRQRNLSVYESKFLPAFAGWNAAAERVGVKVLNATPGSALKEFPMVDFE